MTIRARILNITGSQATIKIVSTSQKIKTVKMIEEKVFVKTKDGEAEGTVIEAFESTLVLHFNKRLKEKENSEVLLRRHSNHNNEILLKAGESFFSSGKFIHPEIFTSYTDILSKSNLTAMNDVANMSDISDLNETFSFFNNKLNDSQRAAVLRSLSEFPLKILGPPGTGKTETIVEIISQLLKQKKKVLVCGPSNIAVDNIISRFLVSEYNTRFPTQFYRLGSSFKGLVHFNIENLAAEAVSFMEKEKEEKNFWQEKSKRKQEFISQYKKQCPLVFSTLFSTTKESFFFDFCIVDEACQATQLECFTAIAKARNFLLVGDPNQLSPKTSTLYERLNLPTIILKEQYRMHTDLLAFSNEYFYNKAVESPKTDEFMFFEESKILLIDTSYFGYQEGSDEHSKMNQGEAALVQKVVEWLKKKGESEIGVISPYSAQVRLLRDLLDVQVETVDGFQGQERDFIILSLVRSNEESEIGFLQDKKRLNVAITRCKRGLVVIADVQNFMKDAFFRLFFRFLEDKAYVLDPVTFEMLTEVVKQ
ncbi:hypothetical protein GINT2_001030 [Glugoides intestinalis]